MTTKADIIKHRQNTFKTDSAIMRIGYDRACSDMLSDSELSAEEFGAKYSAMRACFDEYLEKTDRSSDPDTYDMLTGSAAAFADVLESLFFMR